MAGILACALFVGNVRYSGALAAILSCACLGVFVFLGADTDHRVFFGLAIAATLPYLCELERSGKMRVPAFFVWGGAISYAVYLVHAPVLSVTSRVFGRANTGWEIALILSVVVSVAAGAVFYQFWEKPLMRSARRLWHLQVAAKSR